MDTPRLSPPSKGNGRRKRAPLPVGRQTKLTPEVQKKIVDAVRAGAFLSVAARYAGVGPSTLMLWMERGRQVTSRKAKDAIYLEFLEEVEAAEAQAEVAANLQWRAAWAKDWHAAKDWLVGRHPDRYGANRDPNAPTGAFAGVNITIGGQTTPNGTNGNQNAANVANVPLETLIEANPRLLSATMHLFDEIDAIYEQNGTAASDSEVDHPQTPNENVIRVQNTPIDSENDPFGVIEGTFTPLDHEID